MINVRGRLILARSDGRDAVLEHSAERHLRVWDARGGGVFADAAARFLAASVPVAAICGATPGLAGAGVLDEPRTVADREQPSLPARGASLASQKSRSTSGAGLGR